MGGIDGAKDGRRDETEEGRPEFIRGRAHPCWREEEREVGHSSPLMEVASETASKLSGRSG